MAGRSRDDSRQEPFLRVAYAHIVEVPQSEDEEEELYVVMVALEQSVLPIKSHLMVIPLEETPEFLAATYGSPSDLVGRRVRIEYMGHDVAKGVGRIVPGRTVSPIGTTMDLPSRGFRFAAAGRTGV